MCKLHGDAPPVPIRWTLGPPPHPLPCFHPPPSRLSLFLTAMMNAMLQKSAVKPAMATRAPRSMRVQASARPQEVSRWPQRRWMTTRTGLEGPTLSASFQSLPPHAPLPQANKMVQKAAAAVAAFAVVLLASAPAEALDTSRVRSRERVLGGRWSWLRF